MTEDEAKTKWCPFVRFNFPPIPNGDGMERWNNRDSSIGGGESEASCIGSECMAFRWLYDSDYQVFTDYNGSRFEANTVGRLKEAQENNYKPLVPVEGYCGPAGKP